MINPARGNILFLILLAVILFAALSYAVTNSLRGGGKDASTETTSSYTAMLLQYATNMESAVTRMTMRGVKPETLDFYDNNVKTNNGTNANCSTDACRVFKADGGGVTPVATPIRAMRKGVTDNLNTDGETQFGIFLISVKNVGTSAADIILLMRGINDAICNEINVKMGVINQGDAALNDNMGSGTGPGTGGTDYQGFGGNIMPFPTLTADALGDADARISGKSTFCFNRGAAAGNYMVHVLYVR